MELRRLRYFITVAEEGHITRAAERLGMAQPPLSQQIRALEAELDVQLFRRVPRGVELTDAGRVLLQNARSVIAQLELTYEATRRAARGEEGNLCVGVTSTAAFHPIVPRTMRAFREACPMVIVTVEECMSNELIERIQKERMDVAFIRTSVPTGARLTVHPLAQEPMVVALPIDHALATGNAESSIAMKKLAGETFILAGPPGTGLHDPTIAACHAAGFYPNVGNLGASTQQAPRITSLLSLVAAGLGVACVPSSLQRMSMEGVVYRRLKGDVQLKALLNLASRKTDQSTVVKQFLAVARSVAKNFT